LKEYTDYTTEQWVKDYKELLSKEVSLRFL
jgi:hypothetical protein